MKIAERLRSIVPSPCRNQRPFVCNGKLESCQLIIIGENPAVELGTDWWDFFDGIRFDLKHFNDVYDEKTNGGKTVTRARIDALINPLREKGIGCIDTNADRHELRGGSRNIVPNDDVLEILLGLPRLKVIIAHGNKAKRAVERKIKPNVLYLSPPHFSRASNATREKAAHQAARALGLQ